MNGPKQVFPPGIESDARPSVTKTQVNKDFHLNRMESIEQKYDLLINHVQKTLDDVNRRWNDIHAETEREPRYAELWYIPCLALLAICEVPVNRLSFELFFNESPVLSIAVALLIGVVLVVLSHFLGLAIRRLPHNVRSKTQEDIGGNQLAVFAAIPTILQILVLCALIYAICYGVGVLRQGYLAFVTQPDPTLQQMLENSNIVGAAAQLVLNVTLAVEGWIFFWINIAIVSVGALLSYFCHDPHPDYAAVDKQKKQVSKRLERILERKARAVYQEQTRRAGEMVNQSRR